MNESTIFSIEVSGKMACFTRPEFKVERMSYDVITPSAARAIFEAVYWKPQIKWQVLKIEVLNPIEFIHIRRNEVAAIASTRREQIYAADFRQQRSSLVLRDVRYRLTAQIIMLPSMQHPDNTIEKHIAIFLRRASKGQCFTQPYLGCREFSADWNLSLDNQCVPIVENRDLGMMLYDIDFSDIDNVQPIFFNAVMNNGVITLPVL